MPEESLKPLKKIYDKIVVPSQPGKDAFQLWNRHACQLAVQFVEQQKELALRNSAVEQGGYEGEAEEDDDTPPLRVQQVKCALLLDADLGPKLLEISIHEVYKEIVNRLLNFGQPTAIDYRQAFVTLYRIGERLDFLENVITNLDGLIADSTPEAWQVIFWAYQEARISNRNEHGELLRRKLLESPTMAQKFSEVETEIATDRLERELSPMGRLALRSANWDLLQAADDSRLWRDAGMISLGFFRILELEFNERLIFPMMQVFDIGAFEMRLAELKAGEIQGSRKKAIEFWEKIIEPLHLAKQDRKGLELGALEKLLRKVAAVTGVDNALKASLHSGLCLYLSPTGIDALMSSQLAMLVESLARERYRNPPAHSRYTSLATALECKTYVMNSLERLAAYTADRVQ